MILDSIIWLGKLNIIRGYVVVYDVGGIVHVPCLHSNRRLESIIVGYNTTSDVS